MIVLFELRRFLIVLVYRLEIDWESIGNRVLDSADLRTPPSARGGYTDNVLPEAGASGL